MSVKVKPRAQNKSHFNIPQVQCPLKIRCPFLSLSKVNDRFPPKSFLPLPYIKQCTFYCPILHHRAREREREMRGTSKVIMGATLVMVVSLAIVVGLILVLLAELYCSLLLRRRQLRDTNSETATTTTAIATVPTTTSTPSSEPSQPQNQSSPPPLRSFYAQGVLHAPRSLLFPAFSTKEDNAESKKQHSKLHHIIDVLQTQETNTSPRQIGLLSASSSPPTPFIHITTPKPIQEVHIQGGGGDTTCNDKDSGIGEHFMYISNPIYDNDARPSIVDTPFETPDTSPSRLEMSGSSGDDEVAQTSPCSPSSPTTPPLTPMKKLPAEACSVSLKNARSLGTSGSESNSNNGHSSSSSGSPCTSPSW